MDIAVISSIFRSSICRNCFFLQWLIPSMCQALANITEDRGHQEHYLTQLLTKHFRLCCHIEELIISVWIHHFSLKPCDCFCSMNRPYNAAIRNSNQPVACEHLSEKKGLQSYCLIKSTLLLWTNISCLQLWYAQKCANVIFQSI